MAHGVWWLKRRGTVDAFMGSVKRDLGRRGQAAAPERPCKARSSDALAPPVRAARTFQRSLAVNVNAILELSPLIVTAGELTRLAARHHQHDMAARVEQLGLREQSFGAGPKFNQGRLADVLAKNQTRSEKTRLGALENKLPKSVLTAEAFSMMSRGHAGCTSGRMDS